MLKVNTKMGKKGTTIEEFARMAAQAIREGKPFDGGNVQGEPSGWAKQGYLSNDEYKAITDTGPVYVVYSYATPIAWVDRDGNLHRVERKFSPSTTSHQRFMWRVSNYY